MPYFPNMPYQTDHTHHTYPTYHTTPPPHHGGEGGPVPHPHHTTGRGTVQCHTPTTPQGGNGKISYGGSIWDPMSWGGGRAWCKYIHHIPIHHIPTYDVHVRIVRPPPERPATRRTARSGLATWMAQTWPLTSSPSMPPVSAKPNFKKSSEPWSTEPKLSTEDGGDWGRAFGWGGPAAACFFKTRTTWNVNTMMLPGFFSGMRANLEGSITRFHQWGCEWFEPFIKQWWMTRTQAPGFWDLVNGNRSCQGVDNCRLQQLLLAKKARRSFMTLWEISDE